MDSTKYTHHHDPRGALRCETGTANINEAAERDLRASPGGKITVNRGGTSHTRRGKKAVNSN